jgi:hypothetical protein
VSDDEKTPGWANDIARPERDRLGYPAGLVAVLFDKIDRLIDRLGPLTVVILLESGAAMCLVYLARESAVAVAASVALFAVAATAAIFARIRGLL